MISNATPPALKLVAKPRQKHSGELRSWWIQSRHAILSTAAVMLRNSTSRCKKVVLNRFARSQRMCEPLVHATLFHKQEEKKIILLPICGRRAATKNSLNVGWQSEHLALRNGELFLLR
jgi:hypothetical protein